MNAASLPLQAVPTPKLRLAVPILEDFGPIARHMRPDEIAQFIALAGLESYHSDTAARAFANTQGPSYVLLDDQKRPVAAGGFDPIRPGVFEAWGIGTLDGWAKHWRGMTFAANRVMRDLFAQGAHRIQTVALASRTGAHEWYERGLRMQREGVHPGFFADGQTGISFARVKQEVRDGRR